MLRTSAELFERAQKLRAEHERLWRSNRQLEAQALARLNDLHTAWPGARLPHQRPAS